MTPRSTAVLLACVILAVCVAGCGSQLRGGDPAPKGAASSGSASGGPASTGLPQAHPQAINPVAGVTPEAAPGAGGTPIGDPTAHAPSLAEVKRELRRLNLCGGTNSAADATPIVLSHAAGFVADPGTQQAQGQLPVLTHQLDQLGRALSLTIYGISGYRTPQHSVAVGGFANDPHTRGEAEDIGVGSLLRSSAAQISEAQLARFGLYRPFDPSDDPNNTEVNHVQLIPAGGELTLAQAQASFDPDPTCK